MRLKLPFNDIPGVLVDIEYPFENVVSSEAQIPRPSHSVTEDQFTAIGFATDFPINFLDFIRHYVCVHWRCVQVECCVLQRILSIKDLRILIMN